MTPAFNGGVMMDLPTYSQYIAECNRVHNTRMDALSRWERMLDRTLTKLNLRAYCFLGSHFPYKRGFNKSAQVDPPAFVAISILPQQPPHSGRRGDTPPPPAQQLLKSRRGWDTPPPLPQQDKSSRGGVFTCGDTAALGAFHGPPPRGAHGHGVRREKGG